MWESFAEKFIKSSAHNISYPYFKKNITCIGMLLTNLADPAWIQVPCETPMVSHVFCLMEKPQKQSSPFYPTLNVYDKKCIFIEGKCHKFICYQIGDILPKWCVKRDNSSTDMEKFKFLYEAVNYFLPIFSHNLR